jgi:hypothetical protein
MSITTSYKLALLIDLLTLFYKPLLRYSMPPKFPLSSPITFPF